MSGKEWSPWNLPNERGGESALQDSDSAPQWSNKFSRGTKKHFVRPFVDGLIATRSMLKSLAM